MRIGRRLAVALTFLAVIPALAQEDRSQVEGTHEAHMGGLQMGQSITPMMQMMKHCAEHGSEMMQEMPGAEHHEGQGGMNGMDEPAMHMPGMAERNHEHKGGFDASMAEGLARAFLAGQAGATGGVLEIVQLVPYEGQYVVEYRLDGETGRLQVDAQTGEVSEADDEG